MKNKSQLIRWKLCNSLLLLIWLCPTWTNSLHAGNLPLALDDNISSGRFTLSLSGKGWYMWRDKQATWKNDRLYLPHEAINLTQLPANAPTGVQFFEVVSRGKNLVSFTFSESNLI